MPSFEEVWAWIAPGSILGRHKAFNLYQAVAQTVPLLGAVVEVGVYQGSTARMLRMIVPEAPLHLYDTFQGIVQADHLPMAHRDGEFAASLEEVKATVGEGPGIFYHPGRFPDSFQPIGPIRFVHSDTDTYAGTMASLVNLIPYLVPGGVFVVDDYGWPQCPGVQTAVDAFLASQHRQLGYQRDRFQIFLKMA